MVKKTDSPQPKKADGSTSSPRARYFEGVGRRKTAVARVRIVPGKGGISVNNKEAKEYFRAQELQQVIVSPLYNLKMADKFDISAKVSGGGINAQAEALRLGLSRALVLLNPDLKKPLRGLGFMTRDSRMVERKKYGLKKARRAPQWQKR